MSSVAPGLVSSLLVTDITAYTRYAHGPSCSLQPPPPAGFPRSGCSHVPYFGCSLSPTPMQDIGGLSSGPYLCVSMTIPNHPLTLPLLCCIPLILPFFQVSVLVYMTGMPTTDAHWPTPIHPSCSSSNFPRKQVLLCLYYHCTTLPPKKQHCPFFIITVSWFALQAYLVFLCFVLVCFADNAFLKRF